MLPCVQAARGAERSAPEPAVEFASGGVFDGRVAGQAIGQQAHVGGAARIGVVAERHEARALSRGGAHLRQVRQEGERLALQDAAEQHDEIVFRADGLAPLLDLRSGEHACRAGEIGRNERFERGGFALGGDLQPLSSLSGAAELSRELMT